MSSFYTRAPKITIIRCMLPEMWHAIDFVPFFALLFLDNLEKHISEKLKKTPGDMIILHMCTINNNYMM